MTATIHVGDCLETMRGLPDASVDAIVTDPPYGISFMGKGWDSDVPPVAVWAECLRVLKPGGHLLAFAGTRTQHRMATRIEDAGFEIRDMIAWVYGSGFPKSLDVSKAIDKLDASEARTARRYRFTEWMVASCQMTPRQMDEVCGTNTMGRHWTDVPPNGKQPDVPTREHFEKLRPHIAAEVPPWVEEIVDERTVESRNMAEREVVSNRKMRDTSEVRIAVAASAGSYDSGACRVVDITAPATEAARQWQGWGTALKPALEPITVARKPLAGTVAANVLEHGTGGLNIDGCRIATSDKWQEKEMGGGVVDKFWTGKKPRLCGSHDAGRWPANLIHDGSDEVGWLMPEDAARFFYCAKPSTAERGRGNNHATVKPVDLMRYLVRLVTPKGGTVLDPFTGSGTTGIACVAEGFDFIGCELSQDYADIARRRITAEAPIFVQAVSK